MYKEKKILAIIPARSGSKGIKNKNIIEINGRPLIDFSIKAANNSKYIDTVFVSTDSLKIAEIAMLSGAKVPFLRPERLAQDESNIIDSVIDIIEKLSKENDIYDYIILLQPTQPLRNTSHIDEAIELIVDKNYQSLVSVTEVKENPLLMRVINNDNSLKKLLNTNSTLRRQDFPKYFKVNGAIYINKIDERLTLNTSLNDNKYAYIMDEKYDVDIDENYDLEVFKLKLDLLSIE